VCTFALAEVAIATMLVGLLKEEDQAEKAARAISRLAGASRSNQDAVAKAGGIPLLVALLRNGVDAMRVMDDEQRRVPSADGDGAGASTPSIASIRPSYEDESIQLTPSMQPMAVELPPPMHAPITRSPLAISSLSVVVGIGGSAPPAEPSPVHSEERSERTVPGWLPMSALKEMASAMWSMASGNEANQAEIAAAGGIPPLITMVSSYAKLHRNAAGALWALAASSDNQQLIARANGIAP
jgi:hypothetical protein